MSSVGGNLYETFKYQVSNIVVNNYDTFISTVEPLANSILGFYVVVIGYNALKGNLGEFTRDALISASLVIVVYSFVFETKGFINWFYYPLISAIEGMTRLIIDTIGNTNSSDFNSSVDAAFASVFDSIREVSSTADTWGVGQRIKTTAAIFILLLVFGLNYLLYFGLIIVSIVSLHIQFVMGIFIIFLSAFKATRFVFFNWLKDLATYALWPLYASIIMGICLIFFKNAAYQMSEVYLDTEDIFTANYAMVVIVGAISLWLFWKVPQFSASLTGGAAGGASGLAGGLIGGLASGAAITAMADRGKDSDGNRISRSAAIMKSMGNTIGNSVSASRGFINGRKLEGD